ncbi:TetR/AcrR family transcriptional regulator [Streptomyces silvisoli]|uniref:TetR family transcriptional regulator n=1 Tax=Streptomyces silvisoli TaxID=3034235 RepID=A0ABT5ZM87_9ACTN|nr:TetR family transcriptional regulator [Streptomyces silvisoli]MDF3290709.1 TetR family transcriptional regulator [Streptomyces silvisoli]
MSTVNWTAWRRQAEPRAEGLRERKKRLMRQRLSDTATEMFLERGFDAVRVSEIAQACGVSEKTVFNYFPTKESLILDLGESTMAALRAALARPDRASVEAVLGILSDELSAMTSWIAAQEDSVQAAAMIQRFGALTRSTPSLRAYHRDMTDRLVVAASEVLAQRIGMGPDDPEPQIAATALLGLWPIQFQSLRKYLDGKRTPAQVHTAVTADVRRAAELISTGLASFAGLKPTSRP